MHFDIIQQVSTRPQQEPCRLLVEGPQGHAILCADGGYVGPCPPWNDERVHSYHVTVYALDVDRLNLPDLFTRADLIAAAKEHILASGSRDLFYTLNAKAGK